MEIRPPDGSIAYAREQEQRPGSFVTVVHVVRTGAGWSVDRWEAVVVTTSTSAGALVVIRLTTGFASTCRPSRRPGIPLTWAPQRRVAKFGDQRRGHWECKGPTVGSVEIRPARPADRDAAVRLWEQCNLTRPWNDARRDFDQALRGPSSTVFVGELGDEIVATVMAGFDGHRGWVYYLACDPSCRRQGLGAGMMRAAEDWLRAEGAVKVQLMVRRSNSEATAFYERLGFDRSDVLVLARWLDDGSAHGA